MADENTLSGSGLFSAGADGVQSITIAGPTMSVIYVDANGVGTSQEVSWSAVTNTDGSVTYTGSSDNVSPAAVLTVNPDGSYTYTFDQFYPTVYWGVRASNDRGSSISDLTYSIRLDSQAPTVAAMALPAVTDSTSFVVRWNGSDNTAGIDHYDVQVRDNADGTWKFWLTNTKASASARS